MITLGKVQDFTPRELGWLQDSMKDVNEALADPAFISILMAATYENTEDSNETIVKNITSDIVVDNIFCENLGWYATKINHTIAEESPDGSITCNRPFFDNESEFERSNTLLHEVGHKAGYSHAYSTQYLSVPYQIGNLLQTYLEKKYNVNKEG